MSKYSQPRVAVITGGAGGIGQAFAERLAKDGADIAIVDVKDGEETRGLVEAQGRKFLAIPADITDPAQVDAMRDRCCRRSAGPTSWSTTPAAIR